MTINSDDGKPIGTSAVAGSTKSSARIIGSAVAGVSELALFHPVDTVAKRLMATEAQLITISSPSQTFVNLNGAIFRNAALEGPLAKVRIPAVRYALPSGNLTLQHTLATRSLRSSRASVLGPPIKYYSEYTSSGVSLWSSIG